MSHFVSPGPHTPMIPCTNDPDELKRWLFEAWKQRDDAFDQLHDMQVLFEGLQGMLEEVLRERIVVKQEAQ